MMRGFRRGLMLLATSSFLTAAAAAQQQPPPNLPPGAVVQPLVRDDGAELRGHLTTLADNPRSVDAMVGAGRAAMRMGDVEAALTFFGRANELSPRDPRVKAGMASGLLHMGQPQAALSLFAEAVALGAPEVEIAGDRGLGYDLVGDPRRAQQDYLLALGRRDDPEVRRRLALSLAISGQREAALRLIDAQLRSNDRAGWRTQAFVLALTGDAAGASRTAQGVMLPGQAEAMAPFLARLAALNPSEKAMAVHLGRFPVGGPAMGGPSVDTTADPRAVAVAMGGAPTAAPAPARPPAATREASAETVRGRPGRVRSSTDGSRELARGPGESPRPRATTQGRTAAAPPAAPPPAATQVAQADSRWSGAANPAQAPQAQAPAPPRPSALASSGAIPASSTAPPALQQPAPQSPAPQQPAPQQPAPQQRVATPSGSPPAAALQSGPSSPAMQRSASAAPSAVPPVASAGPGFSLEAAPQPATPSTAEAQERPALADIAELVRTLPAEERARQPSPFRAPASRPAPAANRAAVPARSAGAQPAHPSRHWVQIAGGANRAALPAEFARLRQQAPEQLGGRAAYTATLRATNRLLVGPFASPDEAQGFVNQLARHNVAAFAWTSEAGQEIERLQTGR
ncbi:SPOR domain-containing protein [Sphingosinicella sp. CPCC 101087]|uniref:SPOR domain-containing protein n=1 Tax=Sphingosinicella sp. CPCC 101087 TaxID=2497754 RepID=UPI0013EC914E|nr:SPOR domain-containing protein [Sphingosinicella sp. CPCC 101087]